MPKDPSLHLPQKMILKVKDQERDPAALPLWINLTTSKIQSVVF
jgi:hypothetical protein